MNAISTEQWQSLVQAAIDVRQRAYAKYSGYLVGAALLCSTGEIVTGCNVENASYGLTICAERSAIASAVSQGLRDFAALAVATDNAHAPCGACRQVMSEFSRDLPILLVVADKPEEVVTTSLDRLLPMQFDLDNT